MPPCQMLCRLNTLARFLSSQSILKLWFLVSLGQLWARIHLLVYTWTSECGEPGSESGCYLSARRRLHRSLIVAGLISRDQRHRCPFAPTKVHQKRLRGPERIDEAIAVHLYRGPEFRLIFAKIRKNSPPQKLLLF
jgi:hypothetical protein